MVSSHGSRMRQISSMDTQELKGVASTAVNRGKVHGLCWKNHINIFWMHLIPSIQFVPWFKVEVMDCLFNASEASRATEYSKGVLLYHCYTKTLAFTYCFSVVWEVHGFPSTHWWPSPPLKWPCLFTRTSSNQLDIIQQFAINWLSRKDVQSYICLNFDIVGFLIE